MLHEPQTATREDFGGFDAGGVKVLGIDFCGGNRQSGTELFELQVQPALIGGLIFEGYCVERNEEVVKVVGEGVAVFRVVDSDVNDGVPGFAQGLGESSHCGENTQNFLGVVEDVIGFLTDLHHHVDHLLPEDLEPRVLGVELVPENQANRWAEGGAEAHGDGWSRKARV